MTMVNPSELFKKRLEDIEFFGIVVANTDPSKQERLRVRVKGLWDEVPDADLPWLLPIKEPCDNTANAYCWDVPDVGSSVRVVFPNSDLYKGRYSASILDANLPIPDYPNTYGRMDKFGNLIYVNKVTGDIITVSGSGKSSFVMRGNGSIEATCTDYSMVASGTVSVTCKTSNVRAQTSATVTTPTLNLNGDSTNIKCTSCTVNASGAVSFTASSTFSVLASAINLG